MWKEKERSRIRAVKMDNLGGLLGTRRMECTDTGVMRSYEEGKRKD